MCDFSKCRDGIYKFVKVMSISVDFDEEKAIRWCSECSAKVIDHDIDKSTMTEYYKKLTYPKIKKKYILKYNKTFKEVQNA